MSHSVVITVSHVSKEIGTCEKILNQLNEIKKQDWVDKKIINKLIKETNDISNDLKNSIGKKVGLSELKEISSMSKKAINLLNSFDRNKMIKKFLDLNTFNFQEKIASDGTMFYDTISYMEENNIKIDEKNYQSSLEIVRQTVLDSEKIKEYQNNFIKQLKTYSLPNELSKDLLDQIRKTKTSQEISDVPSYLEHKKEDYENAKKITKDFMETIKEIGFAKTSKLTIRMNEEQDIYIQSSFKNKNNNEVKVNIYSSGEIKYKLGNYVGHACEKTTDKILKKLNDKGYQILNQRITRDIDNSKPLFKEAKEQERNK